jgi:HD-GYP domain-containing protein (c-di-GMP phosphodiesterase class II)
MQMILSLALGCDFIASEMGYPKSFIEDIWVAGVLHDIGKIGISDSILNKKGRLTDEEYEIIKQHPAYSIYRKPAFVLSYYLHPAALKARQ